MKEKFFIVILFALALFFSDSCTNEQTQAHQFTKEEAFKFLDSIGNKKLLALFIDKEGYSFLIKNDSLSDEVRKETYVPNFPTIFDTLNQTGINEFESRRFHTTYFINDSAVVVTYRQKIIHPSSNWQGQTPWQEINVAVFRRLDRKVK